MTLLKCGSVNFKDSCSQDAALTCHCHCIVAASGFANLLPKVTTLLGDKRPKRIEMNFSLQKSFWTTIVISIVYNIGQL